MGDDTAADTPANDSSLFRDAVGEVKPVSNNRRIPDTPKVTPKANYQVCWRQVITWHGQHPGYNDQSYAN